MANGSPSENLPPWLKLLVTPLTVGGTFRLAPGRHFLMSGPCLSQIFPIILYLLRFMMHTIIPRIWKRHYCIFIHW